MVLDISKVRPLGKRVLVKRAKGKENIGGILLPQEAQEKPQKAQAHETPQKTLQTS